MNYDSILSQRAQNISPSPIRRFFDMAENMEGVISLGVALLANEAYKLGAFSIFPAGGEYMRVLLCVILGFVIARVMYGKKLAPKDAE